MKKSEIRLVYQTIIRIIAYILIIGGDYALIYLDAFSLYDTNFDEDSFTEWGQEISLMVMIAVFVLMARKYESKRSVATLFAGVGIMALIREYNNFFKDHIFVGSWSILVGIIGIITIYLTYRQRFTLVAAFLDFIQRPGYGMALAGFLTTFVFSRLFGLPPIWETIMRENYIRLVIRAAEEGTELLGYTLMMLGTIEYAVSVNQQEKKEVPVS